MLKLIWLSDLHFVAEGDVLGHDPRVRVQAAIDFINRHHADSDLCVLSGDLVNRGTLEDYGALAERLSGLNLPVLPMVGNHDDRQLLRAALSLPEDGMADFVQYAVQTAQGMIICLDTQKPGSDGGELCAERRAWLQDVLRTHADTPAYLFMHHPPMALGLPMQDVDKLDDGEGVLDLICGHANVRHLFIGHVHRPITGTVKGIPFATMRSVLYQAPAPVPAWDWDSFQPGEEAPNLGVLTIGELGVNLQYVQFCSFDEGVIRNKRTL